ncbi:hypothetical protein HT136_08470 [Novosphingobium profundi]|uniref:hypothetical protein n=1 Tax=Novosphingobium profundi TaxID=1774954 RepID=UPI001BDB33F0|nr:hypothetical protein [Novosphingobium profundi]MBT0668402.1 hypothetical protein [Novosphingobium profundi]
MQRVFVAEITAYNPRTDEQEILRMCSAGHGPVSFPDSDFQYIPCIASPPVYSYSLSENGVPGEISIDYGSLGLSFSADLRNLDWRGYDFDGYPCKLMWGEYGAPLSTYSAIPSGRVGALEVASYSVGSLAILGPDSDLKKEVLNASYGGSGASDGGADMKGLLKPFTVGKVENIEPLQIDPAYLVWQYHGYGPTADVLAVYENALTLGDALWIVDSYEELIGLTVEQLPPGTWAKAPAVGMYRLGAEPTGKHTADVIGAVDDNGYAITSFGAIACWMLRDIAGIPEAQIDYDSAAALDADFPHTWGDYLDAREKQDNQDEPTIAVGNYLREAANQLAAYLFPDRNNVWRFGRNTHDKEPITIQQGRTTWPVVTSITKPATTTRAYKVRVGGRRCFSVHSDSEISSALKDAIEEVAVGIGKAVEDISDDVNDLRGNFRDLAREALDADLIEFQDVNLSYGAELLKAQTALHNQNHIAIRTLSTRIDENGALVSEDLTNLTSRVEENERTVEAGFLEVNRTIASEVEAAVEQLETGIASFGDDVDAAFVEERRIRAEKDQANADATDAIELRVGDTEGRISTVERLVAEPNEATLEKIEELGVRITDETGQKIEAAKQEVTTAIVGPNGAATTQFTGINTRFGAVEGRLQEVESAVAGDDGAWVQRVSSLEARLDPTNAASYEQNVQLIADTNGLVRSSLTWKVVNEVNGVKVVGGIGVVGENGIINTAIETDALSVWTPNGKQQLFYLDGQGAVLNSLIANKLQVSQGQITNLLVDTLQVAGNAITANTIHTAGDTYCPANGTVDFLNTGFMTIGDGVDGSGIVSVTFTVDATAYYDASSFVELFVDTGSGYRSVNSAVLGISTDDGNSYWRIAGGLHTVVDGSQVRVLARINSGQHTPRSVARSFYVRNITMTLMGAKR